MTRYTIFLLVLFLSHSVCTAQAPGEENHFVIVKVPSPEGTLLEVGGLEVLPTGQLAVSTRRGDVFLVDNPTSQNPFWRTYASGLHEVLGLAYHEGSLYCAQRSELTRLEDTDGDGRADVFETIYAWPVSGHYHEYSFGPKVSPDGEFFVTGNVAFGNEEWWRGESRVPWRGWTMKISPDGKMEPWATGMRSPAGLGFIDGEFFYTDNQGDWVGSGGLWHVKKGSFMGHPAGLRWAELEESPVNITTEDVYSQVDPRQKRDEQGRVIKPENVINEDFKTLYDLSEKVEGVQLPAVWLPHGVLGISNSDIKVIPDGAFGPFAGQVLIGDQGQSKIMRIFLEKVDGEYQGAAWDFRGGFKSGVMRMAWAKDGSLFVGETNRGWGSAGDANEGLQRLVYSGREPFEMHEVQARPDGFEISFTRPVNKEMAEDLASYEASSYIYKYHPVYGSPPVYMRDHVVKGVKVAEDGMSVRIVLDSVVRHHIHKLSLPGIQSAEGNMSLLHKDVYYTLNNIPAGSKLSMAEVSTKNSIADKPSEGAAKPTAQPKLVTPDARVAGAAPVKNVPTDAEIKKLMDKWTCTACHQTEKKQVGPSWIDIAKRNYTPQEILKLVYSPEPRNWPDYSTPMAPMPHVPEADVLKIAEWINSLK